MLQQGLEEDRVVCGACLLQRLQFAQFRRVYVAAPV